jgi:ABC-2 type transport system ATP-binding protein
MPYAVEAQGIVKHFGQTRAVDGVDLVIPHGQRVGIVGPNGAGKTTTLLMILGAIDPDVGTVDLLGRRLPAGRSQAMNEVGFAAGYLPLPGRLRVHEALEFFADLAMVPDTAAAVSRELQELGIAHLAEQPCQSLSSGQATLVGIAKAFLHEPRLLILDEPTASLDPDVAFRVRDSLVALNEEHQTTLLLTSHDMREVERLTERVIFLRAGKVLADGEPAAVVADGGYDTLEAMFMAEAERLRGRQL